MRCLILVVLLTVTQVPSPVPGKAPDSSAGAGPHVTKKSNNNKSPTTPTPSIVNPLAPNPEQNASKAPNFKNEQYPIEIGKLPPVTINAPKRDLADWILWGFNGLLVVAGFLGIRLAHKTLQTIKEQTEATRKAAEATEKSVELQKVAMEQWVDTDFWEAVPKHIQPNATEADLEITFRLGNPTKFTLRLISLMLWIDRKHVSTTLFGNPLLAPDDDTPVSITNRLEGVKLARYRAGYLPFEIGGLICFIDAFKERREQFFGFNCTCGPANKGKFEIVAFSPPSAGERKAQQKKQPENPIEDTTEKF
jgi:hypothetical protein